MLNIVAADLELLEHQRAIVELLDAYSRDPMGDGKPLSDTARRDLIPGLQAHPTTVVWLAFEGNEPVGLAICFVGFSTFAARPLINVHDLGVLPDYRGQGVGRRLLQTVEEHARQTDCCKLTLEVLENNAAARGLYEALGFAQAEHAPGAGGALFYSKKL